MRFTGGRGTDVVLDVVGGDTFVGSLRVAARQGRVIAMANVALAPSAVHIHGFQITDLMEHGWDPRPDLAELLDALATNRFTVPTDSTFPVSRAADAHRCLDSRATLGKIVLTANPVWSPAPGISRAGFPADRLARDHHAGTAAERPIMIFIVVKFPTRPEHTERFLARAAEFTQATRAEEGNIFFEWARSVEEPDTFVLTEAFQDGTAGAHVNSDHFTTFVDWAPDVVSATPSIISVQDVPGRGWGEMGEIKPR